MQKFMKRICALILSVVMVGSMLPQVVSAAEAEYQIYPTPHEMTYESGSFELKDLNVIYGDGMDEATEARFNETAALLDLEVSESETADAAKTNVYVAIYGSDDAAADYIEGKYEVDAALFEKADANFVAVNNGEIVVLGKDVDSCFYGITTLYHVFTQITDGTIRNFEAEDYADVVSRGFIEGYYGNPWSTEDRVNLMTWGGYYKLNSYFYAPKDDPKHNSNWKELYTEEEIETKIKPLAEAGNASKCRFVYALHPYMYNAIRYSSEAAYQEDLAIMQAKFAQVIEAGVRQIAILADDAGNVGSSNYIKTLNDMTDWLKEMQKTYPDLKLTLPFCTQEYMSNGYAYYANFPENVQIVMTGGKVWGEVTNSFTTTFTNTVGRGPYMWINWPCTDNSKKHLIMGGYTTFLHAGVDPSKIQGIVLNPMQQSEPSKVAIFGNACYSWNIWETNEEADAAWDASFSYVDHNNAIPNAASNALRELSKHMINQNMDSRVTALQESVELKASLTAFKNKLKSGGMTEDAINELIAEFELLAEASKTFRAEAGDENLRDQIVYWLNCWDDTTTAALGYLNAIKAILNKEGKAAIWENYSIAQEAFENSKSYGFHYVDHTEYAEVGVQHIVPFIKALEDYLAPIATSIANPAGGSSGGGTTTEVTLSAFEGSNPRYYSGNVNNVVDGDEATFVWYADAGQVGQYIGVDLGATVKLGTVKFVQDGGDHFGSYELQYSTDGSTYTTYATYSNASLDLDLTSANIEARYVRFYNKALTNCWIKIYEIDVTAASSSTVITNKEAYAGSNTSVTLDLGKLSTTGEYTLAADEYIGIDLFRIKDLATIEVADQGALTLEVSKNMVDWVAVEAGEVDEDARYVRLINKTADAVTVNLTKFEVTSDEITSPFLYETNVGVNSSWGVGEDCRNNGAAFDGNVSTITEFGDFVSKDQYIIYDLGQLRDVYKLEIYCSDSAVNYIRDAVMSVSADLTSWTDVLTIGDGVQNTGESGVKCIDSDAGYSQATSSYPNYVSIEGEIEATPARYLRILMTAANNERAVVFNEIEINNAEYAPVSNDPTFTTSAVEVQGYGPQNMVDGNLTTSFKADTTEAGYVEYTFSDNLDADRINVVQKGNSGAKVYLYVENDGVREWKEVAVLDSSLVEITTDNDLNLAMKIVWEAGNVPNITEIIRFNSSEVVEPEIPTFPEIDYNDPTYDGNDLPVDGIKVTAGTVEPTEGSLGALLDGDENTFYHSNWSGTRPTNADFWITLELPEVKEISGMRYLPRQSSVNGRILAYEISYSVDGENWTVATTGNWADDYEWKLARFEENVEAKFVKIFATDSKADASGRHLTGAELRVIFVEEKDEPVVPEIPETEVCKVYADVEHGAWYEAAVQYVSDEGIMTGNEGLFSPDVKVSRAVMVETLYKMEGRPEVTDFAAYDAMTDVAADGWYKNSVAWGMNNSIVTGDTYFMTFSPDADVTREQIAAFLYRYANFKGIDTTLSASVDEILGDASVSEWAREAFAWAVDTGLITGVPTLDGEGNTYYALYPQSEATRAQLATMLQRMDK